MDAVRGILELDDSDPESPDQPSTSHDREDPTTSQNSSQALSLSGTSQALDQNLARSLDNLMKEPKKHLTLIAKTVNFNQKQGDNIKAGNYFLNSSDISFQQADKNREPEESLSGEVASSAIPEQTNPIPGSIRLTDSLYMFHDEPISKDGNVFKGVKIYGNSGRGDIAVKSLKYSKDNEREANILVTIGSHQNVSHIVDTGIYHLGPVKHIFIAMELCGPDNLTKFSKGPKQTERIKQILIQQLVNGIAHIHRNNVIHRDVKPDNVLVSKDGMQLKVIDFGLSKEMKPGHSVTKASNIGIGTDGWRAPETYNDNVISKQADVFSLALVIHFIETDGSHPFGDDPVGWSYLIKINQGCDLSKLGSEMRDLVGWMLRRIPKERPTLDQIQQHKYFGGELVCPFTNLCFNQPQTVEELKRQKDEAEKEKQELQQQLVMMMRQQSQESQQMKQVYENKIKQAEKEKTELRQKIKGSNQPQTVEELKRQKDEAQKEKQELKRRRRRLEMLMHQQSQESQQMKQVYENKIKQAEKEKKELRQKIKESQSSSQASSSVLRIINQQPPDGRMSVERLDESLPGYGGWSTNVITYSFPAGSLNSVVSYEAKEFTEYLPYIGIIPLLEKAFNTGLLFKIQISGSSIGEIIWNDEIPHKTNKRGGPDNNGYPDGDYFDKLYEALMTKLRALGIEYYQ
ncbi:uncharacterized protein LOC120331568 isoform X1 [Styela clava]